jgi:hypothetical protein
MRQYVRYGHGPRALSRLTNRSAPLTLSSTSCPAPSTPCCTRSSPCRDRPTVRSPSRGMPGCTASAAIRAGLSSLHAQDHRFVASRWSAVSTSCRVHRASTEPKPPQLLIRTAMTQQPQAHPTALRPQVLASLQSVLRRQLRTSFQATRTDPPKSGGPETKAVWDATPGQMAKDAVRSQKQKAPHSAGL